MTSASSRIAVIGASSMVGSRFCELWPESENLVKGDLNGSPDIDVTDQNSVQKFFNENDFSTAILFSAYTDVDGAEAQRDDKNGLCWKINVDGVINISEACDSYNRSLIFISTDFVFDGKNGPYSEDAKVGADEDLTSWYGITKIEGEKIISAQLQNHIILRIAYPYRAQFEAKDDLYRRTLKAFKAGELYPMFNDQQMTPTFIDDLAPAIDLLLQNNQTGIFHLASPTLVTPFDLTKKLIATFGGDPSVVKPGSIAEFLKSGDKTPRPVKGGLKVDKITRLGFKPTTWDDGIQKIYEQSEGEIV